MRGGRVMRYGDPALARVMNLLTPMGEHLGFMVKRPGKLPPAGPFSTIGEAEAQAVADKHAERRHNRENVDTGGEQR
jgi:hypothetical protein